VNCSFKKGEKDVRTKKELGSKDQKSEEAFADMVFASENAVMDKTGWFEVPVKAGE